MAVRLLLLKPLVLPGVLGGPETRIEELVLDFDALTGADVEEASRSASGDTLNATGNPIGVMVFDTGFHAAIAAKASKTGLDVLRKLGARDFLKLTQTVQGFFLGTLSEAEPEKPET